MSKFALISTVDTIGDGFPSHCVMLFESEEEAVKHAVDLIVEYDDSVDVNEGWSIGTEHWDDAKEFLNDWQENLSITEYFHVKPVVPVTTPRTQANQNG